MVGCLCSCCGYPWVYFFLPRLAARFVAQRSFIRLDISLDMASLRAALHGRRPSLVLGLGRCRVVVG